MGGYAFKYQVNTCEDGEEALESKIQAGELFNEGVTDLMAQEITQEYLRQTGGSLQKNKKDLMETGRYTYHLEKIFIASFVRKMSLECNVPVDVVWKSIKQGYFSGLPIYAGKISDELNAIFGENFSLNFYSRNHKDTIHYLSKYLREHFFDPWDNDQKSKALEFMDILGDKNTKPAA